MTLPEEPCTRDERRQRTEAAILRAARELFAETGFERTTIRAVAARAGVDPALVMQHHGSKEGLFGAAARFSVDHERIVSSPSDSLAREALLELLQKMQSGEDREATAALMRSCLTHPGAARVMREEVLDQRSQALAGVLQGDDALLRANLFCACMMGLGLARYLLQTEPLASASEEDLLRLMQPVLQVLVDPPAPAPGSGDAAPGSG